jgi:Uncharacterised nucleotidyltransferase
MSPWSPEFELVALLARIDPTPKDRARARVLETKSLDWDRLLTLATHHGVAPLVAANLSCLNGPPDLAGFPQRLRQIRLSLVRTNLTNYGCWLESCRAFEDRGIPAMTLKGFHVALSTYGDLGLRPVGDLDFLVHRDDVSASLDLLEELGYHLWPQWRLALRNVGLEHVLRSTYQIALSSDRGTVIDLHWEAGSGRTTPPAQELIAGAELLSIGEQDVLVAPPDVAMTLLLVHGHKSAWGRLRWLVDVAEGMERLTPIEYNKVVRRLEELGMGVALGNAVGLIRSLWGRPPSHSPESTSCNLAVHPKRFRYYRMLMERDRDMAQKHDWGRPARMLQIRLGRRSSFLAAAVSASRPNFLDWGFVPLPGPLRLGYWFVRPIRVLLGLLTERTGAKKEPSGVAPLPDH